MPNFNRTKNTDVDIILNWNNNITVPLASRIFLTNEKLSLRAVRTACSSWQGSVSSILIQILSKSSQNQNSIPTQTKVLNINFTQTSLFKLKWSPHHKLPKDKDFTKTNNHQNQQPKNHTRKWSSNSSSNCYPQKVNMRIIRRTIPSTSVWIKPVFIQNAWLLMILQKWDTKLSSNSPICVYTASAIAGTISEHSRVHEEQFKQVFSNFKIPSTLIQPASHRSIDLLFHRCFSTPQDSLLLDA